MKISISLRVKFGDGIDMDKADSVKSFVTDDLPDDITFAAHYHTMIENTALSIFEEAARLHLLPEIVKVT